MSRSLCTALFATVALLVSACSAPQTGTSVSNQKGGVEVQDAWARAAVAMAMDTTAEGGAMAMDTTAEGGAMAMDTTAEGGAMDMDMGGSTSAIYMTLNNNSDQADAIVGATTDVAQTVELHTSGMEDGIMRMRPVDEIEIPANGEATLEPGGFHIMLIGLKQDLKAGEIVPLTIDLKSGTTISVDAEVRAP